METKHFIFFGVLFILVPLGIILCCIWRKVLDLMVLLMVLGSAFTREYDINFVSRSWYQGTTKGLEISFIDFFAIIVLFGALWWRYMDRQEIFWPASLGLMQLYFFYCCFTTAFADPMLFGVLELSKMVRGFIYLLAGAMVVRSRRDIYIILLGLFAAVAYEWYLSTYQRYGPVYIPRSQGNFIHFNSLSIYCCMVLPIFAAAALSNIRPLLRLMCGVGMGMALISVLLTVSRTGFGTAIIMLVLVGVTCVQLPKRFSVKQMGIGFMAFCIVGLIILKSWDTIGGRFSQQRSITEEYTEGTRGRGEYFILAEMMLRDHFFGVGLNNWSYYVTNEYYPRLGLANTPYPNAHDRPDYTGVRRGLTVAQPAHSLLALTIAELGITGLIVFALMWGRWFQMSLTFLFRRSSDIVSRLGLGLGLGLLGCFVHNLTEWGWRYIEVYLIFHFFAGMLAALYHMRDKPGMMAGSGDWQRNRVPIPGRPE